MKIWQTV